MNLNTMRRAVLTIFFSVWLTLLSTVPAAAMTTTPNDDIDVVMFYGNGCSHCARAEAFLGQLEGEYPQLKVHLFEVYADRENIDLMVKYANAYGVSAGAVPTIFIGDQVIIGDSLDKIRVAVENCALNGCESALRLMNAQVAEVEEQPMLINNIDESPLPDTINEDSPTTPLPTLTLSAVISGAAVDAINPCEFAVLIILLTTVLGSGSRRRALLAGLAFATSVYLSYFLMGLGLYSAIAATGLSRTFYIIVSVLAIIVGLFNLKDWLWYGKWFVMEVPLSWRPRLQKLVRGVTSIPGAFLIGFLVSLFLLPCTSGPYIVILGLLADTTTRAQAIPLLLLYNLIFVLPMIIITIAVYRGLSTPKELEEKRIMR
ncbi:cytochrome c biogenesis protein, partial [Patescibacteria group bacterium]|nr:cytochrome c biogenesis protein [Patescibacteria group bacterium]